MYMNNNLIYLRKRNDMSLRRLEKCSNISHTVIERIEKRKTLNPEIITIIEICKVFDISIDDFLFKDLTKISLKKKENKLK